MLERRDERILRQFFTLADSIRQTASIARCVAAELTATSAPRRCVRVLLKPSRHEGGASALLRHDVTFR
jgi:hypothetical protein